MEMIRLETYAPYQEWFDHLVSDRTPIVWFEVPEDWLELFLKREWNDTLEKFMSEWTYDCAEQVRNAWEADKETYELQKKREADLYYRHTPCPLCSTEERVVDMEHREHEGTHIYVCPECPGVLYEYHNNKNTQALFNHLEEDAI